MRHSSLGPIGSCSAIAGAIVSLGACNSADSASCEPIVSGVMISVPSVDVSVRDAAGRGQAIGTTVTARELSRTVQQGTVQDSVHVLAGFGTGTFEVHVSKPFYRDTTVSKVVVAGGMCGTAISAKLLVTIQLLPGAPHVRSVGILGAGFLATPGAQLHLVPYVDADAGSSAVSWSISDTTLARIDASGVMTAKCSRTGGADTVTATSAVDPTVHGQTVVGVGVAPSCP
jgi:hypothetical protein